MASIKLEVGSLSTIMTTELDSLADSGNAISSEIDNSSDLYLFDDVELTVTGGGYTTSTDTYVALFLVSEQLDGTGFEDGDNSIDPPISNLVGVFDFREAPEAHTLTIRAIPIPPGKYKYVVINELEQTMPSSGNLLKRRPYRYQEI